MLNYGIIEWEACVVTMIIFIPIDLNSVAGISTMLHEILAGILLEGLTTILFPYTVV